MSMPGRRPRSICSSNAASVDPAHQREDVGRGGEAGRPGRSPLLGAGHLGARAPGQEQGEQGPQLIMDTRQ